MAADANATPPVVATRALAKDYTVGPETVHALAGIDVTIGVGEFVAVMGPSGSGKSTFMHLLGCLDVPSAGQYLLDGVEVSALARDALAAIRNARIGFVFQTFNLLARTTALQNVELPLAYGRVPRAERPALAAAALEAVGLADQMHRQPTQLSGGQQQRVAIARAIVRTPRLVLADEPTGALDTQTGIEIMTLLQRLNDAGTTIVIVTHEAEVARFAQRVLHFRDGRLERDSGARAAPVAPLTSADHRRSVRRASPFDKLRARPSSPDLVRGWSKG